MRALLISLIVLALASCTIGQPSKEDFARADYGPYPENYKKTFINYASGQLKDPYSALYTFGQSPTRGWARTEGGFVFGWRVCAWVNAKNSFGGYTGRKPWQYLIKNDRVVVQYFDGSDEAYRLCQPSGPAETVTAATAKTVTIGHVFNIEDVDKLIPGVSTVTQAKELLGTPAAESAMPFDQKLLQWSFIQATATSGEGAHVAISFDKYGRMIRVESKSSTSQ